MNIKEKLNSIWSDPVISKIIAVAIIAIFAAIPIKLFWDKILEFLKDTIKPFIFNYYLVILLIISVSLNLFFLKKIRFRKKGIKYIKKHVKDETKQEIFFALFWFPLNGILKTNQVDLRFEIKERVNNSKIFLELESNNILKKDYGSIGDLHYAIDEHCYNYLEMALKKMNTDSDDETKRNIENVKNRKFEMLLINAVNINLENLV